MNYIADDIVCDTPAGRLEGAGAYRGFLGPFVQIVTGAQMIDPDRSIDQDHLVVGRRRGTGAKSGSLPPSRAKRRALSRSISALRASRTNADFSRKPV